MNKPDAFDLLAELHATIRREYRSDTTVGDLGLSPLASQMLMLVARYPGWPQQKMGDATGREKSQIARAMKELKDNGIIVRAPATRDGRTKAAVLTDKGTVVLGRLRAARKAMAQRAFQHLAESELDTLTDMLQRVLQGLGVVHATDSGGEQP